MIPYWHTKLFHDFRGGRKRTLTIVGHGERVGFGPVGREMYGVCRALPHILKCFNNVHLRGVLAGVASRGVLSSAGLRRTYFTNAPQSLSTFMGIVHSWPW